ncbi:BatA domain-containing protein [Tundrisphaera lichenicola]|uniref:BatA domain-containing protein n=1 Tax=Tundrisphaera lichenicola TaxID=2029860 RepID=UPI003EBCFF21
MMSFLSPLLAWGALLGAIPIIIHLLNRRKFRRVDWAPMRYLKLTVQRNRRRIQIEQLLLLLLRVAAMVLLFFYLARPVVNPTGLEGWLGSGGRSSQVVLIDDSLSMGFGTASAPAFGQAKEAAAALVASARPEDRFTILATSAPRAPVIHEVEGSRREDLAGAVASVAPSAVHASWPLVLEGVDEVLRSCTYPTRQLTILTDLRRSGWDAGVAPVAARWAEQGVQVRIIDVGIDDSANVALRSMTSLDRTILAGAESRWEAEIRNDSPRLLSGVKAVLRVDDKPTEVRLPEIAPGQTARIPLTVQFPGAGPHDLSLELPEDGLPGDNRRWAAVPVKDSLLVRLVDGDPSTEPFGSEVDYLAAPMSIGVGSAEAWRVEVANEVDFLNPRLDTPDVLVLANVAAPTPEQADRILKLVKAGMGLMIYTGSKLDAGLYNELLYRGKDPVLPVRLKGPVDGDIRGVIIEALRPSPIEKLLELKTTALERVAVRQIMAVDEPVAEDGQVRVLARWNDPGRSPAVIERVVGEGRVLLWTTTADRAGNDWPIEPSFVLAVREAVRGTARPTRLENNVTAGDPIREVVRSDQQVANARLIPPGGGEPRDLTASPMGGPTDERGPAVAIDVPDTRQAGLYRLTWDEGPLGTQQDAYAANPDARESDLGRIAEPDLKAMLKPLEVEIASAGKDGADLFSPTGREIWHELAWGLFGLLIVESIFATWVGRSR